MIIDFSLVCLPRSPLLILYGTQLVMFVNLLFDKLEMSKNYNLFQEKSGVYFFGGNERTIKSSALSYSTKLSKDLWATSCDIFLQSQLDYNEQTVYDFFSLGWSFNHYFVWLSSSCELVVPQFKQIMDAEMYISSLHLPELLRTKMCSRSANQKSNLYVILATSYF